MHKLRRRQLKLLIEAQDDRLETSMTAYRESSDECRALRLRIKSLLESHEALRKSGELHRTRSAQFGAILHELCSVLGSGEVPTFGDLPDIVREQADSMRVWQNIGAQVADMLPAGAAASPVDIPRALELHLADLRDARQTALSRAAAAERRGGDNG
jgi:hypothetical protein